MKQALLFLLIIANGVPYVQAAERRRGRRNQLTEKQRKPDTNIFNEVVSPINYEKAAKQRADLMRSQEQMDCLRDAIVNGCAFVVGWVAHAWWNKKSQGVD